MQRLLTTELKEKLPPLYSQENQTNPLAMVRYFDIASNWAWYAIQFDGDDLFFGLVHGFEQELGYFRLSELEELNKCSSFPRIERDLTFEPTLIDELR
jgi:hypothetical protein